MQPDNKQSDQQKLCEGEEEDEEEEELDVTIEEVEQDEEEEEESSELWDAWDSELSVSQNNTQASDEQREKRDTRPGSLHLGSSQAGNLTHIYFKGGVFSRLFIVIKC